MTEPRFLCMYHPESTAKVAEWVHDEMDLEQVACPVDEHHRAGGRRLMNLSVMLPRRAVDDFVWTWYSACLIQDHVLDLFRANGLSGYEVKPVKARFKSAGAEHPPRLWELVVTGWGGMASRESGIRLIENCPGCGKLVYSTCRHPEKLIDASQWDGSELFMVWPLPRFIFVAERVADLIRMNRLKGVVLKEPGELEFSSGGFGPGRLSYWMPEERARELGAPLGIE